MILFELFLVYFQIGLFAFGGGYAAMPLIQSLVVDGKGWLSMAEFADLTTIAEMTPGPILVNSATFVGQKIAGLSGALVCTIGAVLPSFIIVLALAYFYTKYRELKLVKNILTTLRPAVVAMIASAGLMLFCLALFGTSIFSEIHLNKIHYIELLLFVSSFALLRKYKTNPIKIIFGTAIIGTILYIIL